MVDMLKFRKSIFRGSEFDRKKPTTFLFICLVLSISTGIQQIY